MGLLSPHLKEVVKCVFPWGFVLSCMNTFTVVSAVKCVTALLLDNLHKQVHCLQNRFEVSLSGGGILF